MYYFEWIPLSIFVLFCFNNEFKLTECPLLIADRRSFTVSCFATSTTVFTSWNAYACKLYCGGHWWWLWLWLPSLHCTFDVRYSIVVIHFFCICIEISIFRLFVLWILPGERRKKSSTCDTNSEWFNALVSNSFNY